MARGFRDAITGTAQPQITRDSLRRVSFRLPPVPEQRRIADILDKADAIRRKRKQAIAVTDQLLRSTFLEMFGDPVTNPKGWPVATIGELCESGGNIVDGPFGSSLKPEHYTSSGVRVIRNWNIRDDFFDESDFRYIDLVKFEEIRRSEVVPEDIPVSYTHLDVYKRQGQTQAALYADCLEMATGQRPAIFFTNGIDIFLWDDVQGYPYRKVYGFYSCLLYTSRCV